MTRREKESRQRVRASLFRPMLKAACLAATGVLALLMRGAVSAAPSKQRGIVLMAVLGPCRGLEPCSVGYELEWRLRSPRKR